MDLFVAQVFRCRRWAPERANWEKTPLFFFWLGSVVSLCGLICISVYVYLYVYRYIMILLFMFACIGKRFNYTLFFCTHVCFFPAVYTYIRIYHIIHGICTPSLFRIGWKSLKSCNLTFSSMKIWTPWSHWWRWLDIALVCDHVLNQIVTCDFFHNIVSLWPARIDNILKNILVDSFQCVFNTIR